MTCELHRDDMAPLAKALIPIFGCVWSRRGANVQRANRGASTLIIFQGLNEFFEPLPTMNHGSGGQLVHATSQPCTASQSTCDHVYMPLAKLVLRWRAGVARRRMREQAAAHGRGGGADAWGGGRARGTAHGAGGGGW